VFTPYGILSLNEYVSLELDNADNLIIASPDSKRSPLSQPHIFSYNITTTERSRLVEGGYEGSSIVFDTDGTMLASHITNMLLARVNPSTAQITQICCDSAPAMSLEDIALESSTTVVATTSLHTVVRINLSTGLLETVASGGLIDSTPNSNNLKGIAVDTNGDILVVANAGIFRVNPANGNQTVALALSDCVTDYTLCDPTDIVVNSAGDWFIATANNVLKYDNQLSELTVLSGAYGFLDLAIDADGNIVGINHALANADPYRYTLQRINTTTGSSTMILNGLGNLLHGVAVAP